MKIILSETQVKRLSEIVEPPLSDISDKDYVFKVLNQRFELYDGERLISECSFRYIIEKRGVHLWGFRVRKEYRNKGIGSLFLEKILGFLKNKIYVVIAEIVNNSFESVRMYKKFGFKIYRRHDYTSTIYKTFNDDTDVDLDEELTYFEDPYYKENDIYDYEPTDDEVARFYRQYFGNKSKEIHQHRPNYKKKKKEEKPKKNGYAKLLYLSSEVGYGPIGLMKWRKNKEMDMNPIEGSKYEVVPDYGEIKQHNVKKYFY